MLNRCVLSLLTVMLSFAFSEILPPSQRNGSVGLRHSVVFKTTQRDHASTLLGMPWKIEILDVCAKRFWRTDDDGKH